MSRIKPPFACSVRDGAFVEPCSGLLDIMTAQHPRSSAKCVTKVTLTNLETFKPSRNYIVAKLGRHQKSGIILNFCPFCGERIDASVTTPLEKAESEAAAYDPDSECLKYLAALASDGVRRVKLELKANGRIRKIDWTSKGNVCSFTPFTRSKARASLVREAKKAMKDGAL